MNMSTDSAVDRPARRPRGLRRSLPWAFAGAAAVAVIAVLGFHFRNTGESAATPLTTTPAVDVSKLPPQAKIDPAAKRVAGRFIQTAVARKQLAEAYTLVGPDIKQGQSLASWKTGNISVVPYPVDALETARMKVVYSYPKEISLEIALLPKKGSGVRPTIFTCVLVKLRDRWLVNLWTPRSTPPVPSASGG